MPEIFNASKEEIKMEGHVGGVKGHHSRKLSEDPLQLKKSLQISIQKEIPEPYHNAVSAFNYYPHKVHFVGADKQEKIVLLLRRHPITNLPWIFMAFVMVLAPLLMSFVTGVDFVPVSYQIIFLLSWYLITMAYVTEKFLSWFFNVNILTDERIFDVDFVNLIYREITDANSDQIQDVTVQVGGVIRTMFNYGDVIIQTAAEIPQIDFKAVPKPDVVAQILRELKVEEEAERLEGKVR